MIAVDGSSIARTLSTVSLSRSVGTPDGEHERQREAANPFDHPGWTYQSTATASSSGPRTPRTFSDGTPMLVVDTKTDGPGSHLHGTLASAVSGSTSAGSGSGSGSGPGSSSGWGNQRLTSPYDYTSFSAAGTARSDSSPVSSYNPVARSGTVRNPFHDPTTPSSPPDTLGPSYSYAAQSRLSNRPSTLSSRGQAPSPGSELSVSVPSQGFPQIPSINAPSSPIASIRSWSTDDDDHSRLLGVGVGSAVAGLRRGLTVIRHTDGGVAPIESGDNAQEESEIRGEVHLPPSYGELYGTRG
jgi:hypothetical protein